MSKWWDKINKTRSGRLYSELEEKYVYDDLLERLKDDIVLGKINANEYDEKHFKLNKSHQHLKNQSVYSKSIFEGKIIHNYKLNKGLYKVVLEFKDTFNNILVCGYVDDDGNFDDLKKLDENENEIEFNSIDEGREFHIKHIDSFKWMESNCEIGWNSIEENITPFKE
jgi:hypothetical protein